MSTFSSIISVAELAAAYGDPRLQVIDCRFDLLATAKGREDYLAGHLPGAVYAHLDDDLSAPVTVATGRHPLPGPRDFAQTLERLGISNDSQVIAYDGGPGGIAARLWWMLRWLGHERVAVLDGGFAAWVADGQPTETGAVNPQQGRFEPHERGGWVMTTSELAAALEKGKAPLLVDAREQARFRGELEPIDAVAGRIPGALNFPFANNLDENGRWRGRAALHQAWREFFDGEPAPGWSIMCGSGVTACHLALSAEYAGLPAPRLYAGSWSEWIRDPGRPREP